MKVCDKCLGQGVYPDHDVVSSHLDGECTTCPVPVQCEKCNGTGILYVD